MCTLISVVLVLIHGAILVEGFFNGSRQHESVQTLFFDNFMAGRYNFAENQFSIMLATDNEVPRNVGRPIVLLHTEDGYK